MKKNYLKLIFAIVFASNVFAQNIPSHVPKDGLVGWWPFNGNANDESGNGNNGVVNGATLTTDRNGNSNSAYSFDGVGNFIKIQNSNSLNPGNISISGWFNTNSFASNVEKGAKAIITKWYGKIACNSNGDNYNVQLSLINNKSALVAATSLSNQVINSANSYFNELNKWINFTFIHDQNFGQKIYINGLLVYENQVKGLLCKTNNDLYFGADNALNIINRFFQGYIDDIAIYNRSLTQQEITALYTSTPLCTNPSATITPQGNTTFCQGGFVNLKATEGANYSYEWFNNSQLITGATQSVYQASTNGFYTVKVKDGACSATSNSVPVTVTQYPSSDVSVSGPTTFCEGGSVTLTALGNGSFKWSNGVTSKSITINKSGVYRVEITNNNCTSSSNDYSITVNPNPIAKITPDGPTAFCEGGAVNLLASGGTTYKWNSGILTPSITVTKTGTYYVNVFNSFGCSVYTSYDVNVYPNPTVSITPIAQFTLQNNSSIKLSATPAGGAFKGEGVTGTSFNPSNIGLGKKIIYYNYTSTQGCSGSAKLQTIVVDSIGTKCTSYDTITVTNTINDTVGILKIKFQLTTGIKAKKFTSVSVYPNPTSDVLIIDASDVQALNGYRYKMIDISGKTVYNELVTATKTEIPLKTFGKAGVYILHVVDANNTSIETRQIVLE